MECSHWPTPTPTPTPTPDKMGLQPFCICVAVGVCVGVGVSVDPCEQFCILLLNPFFIGVCVCVGVGQCEHTINVRRFERFTCRLWMCWVMCHGYVDTGGDPVHHGYCLVALLDREHPPRVGSGGDARRVRPVSRRNR